MELLSKGIHLDFCESISGSTPLWRKLYGLQEVPDMGGDPEKVEVTNLEDDNKRYIEGVVDCGDLEFKFFYNQEETADPVSSVQVLESYQVLRALQLAGKGVHFRLVYPDKTGHQWKGSINVKRTGAGVNAALGFALITSLQSAMQDIVVV